MRFAYFALRSAFALCRLGRVSWPGLLMLCALLAGAGRAGAVDIDGLIGFGPGSGLPSRYRPDTWTPVTIYLGGQGVNGVGQLQLSATFQGRTTLYTRRVPLHDGPLNEALHFVCLPRSAPMMGGAGAGNTEITARLLMEGRKLAEKSLSLPAAVTAETFNVLALTRDGSGLNFLMKKRLALVHRHVNPATINGMMMQGGGAAQFATTQVHYADSRALPDMAQGYAMIDAIALADLPTDSLTEDQQEAIREYVRQGGLLILAGGSDLARLKGQFLSELLPLQPTGTTQADLNLALYPRYRESFPPDSRIVCTTGTLKPDAGVLFGTDRLPLVVSRPYGAGVIVFTAFDYLAPEFRGWAGAPAFWRDLLRCGNNAVSPRSALASLANDDRRFYYGGNASTPLADALAGQQAGNTPSWWTVAIFLAAYILLLVPVSYLLLKKLDRRELAWLTAPLLICGFTVASYVIAQSIKGRLLTVNRAVVLETIANSDQAAGYAQMTLYSPGRAAYDITFGGTGEIDSYRTVAPSEIYASDATLSDSLTVEHDKTTTLRGALIKLWDKRSFDTPVLAPLGGPLAAQTQWLYGGKVQVTVTNRTRFALKDCALVNGNDTVSLGDLAPGETKQQAIPWNKSNGSSSLRLPDTSDSETDAASGGNENAARDKIRHGLAQALASNGQNYGSPFVDEAAETFGRAANVFVGWCYDPILNVQVNGQSPAGEEVNLLVAHLPLPANAPPTLRAAANPFLAPPPRVLEDVTPLGSRQGIFK
jgi:hypothetical protein